MPHQAPGHVPPKNVDVVNKMKNNLNHYVEKIGKTEYMSSNYWNCHKKIKELLSKLGTIEINIGTLHATKIGKLMSKYERQLHGELSDVARGNNIKWKSVLSEYRENFKKKSFCRDVKEEPLSQDSFNNLIASPPHADPSDDFTENSCNQILANSQDFGNMNSNGLPRELEFRTLNQSDEETESDSDSNNNNTTANNNNNNDDNEGTEDHSFFVDMHNVVTNVTEALSSVEMECTKMKTMLDYINNKLNDHEKRIQNKGTKNLSPQLNKKIKITNGTSEKKKSSKAHTTTSLGSSSTISNPTNIDVRESFKKSGRAVMPNLLSPSSTNTTTTTTTAATTTVNGSSKKQSVETPPSINNKTRVSSEIATSTSTATTSHSKKQNGNKLDKTCKTPTSGNDHSKKSLPDNGVVKTSNDNTDLTGGIDTNCNVAVNDDDSSSNCSEENTLLYSVNNVKQEEDISDSQDVEFYFHRENEEIEKETNTCVQNNAECVNSPQDKSEDRSKGTELHNKEDRHNDAINTLTKKRENIIKKLKSTSSENRALGLSTETIEINGKTFKKRRPIGEADNIGGSKTKTGSNKLFKSSVFEIDSDGFTVPNGVAQNVLSTPGNTTIIKGQQVNEDVGVNLDDVELEDFFTFSQVVDQSDELDDIEKDYLRQDMKKKRCSWNNSCKYKEGVRYPPLVKSNGRMKAAHKASTGKKVLKEMLNKKRK